MGIKSDKIGFVIATFFFVLFALGVYGWIMNIVQIVDSNEVSGMIIARVVGAFIFPVGAILGFF